jgi:hypothetical protein
MTLQFEDVPLVDVLTVNAKNSFIRMVFVDFEGDYGSPNLLWPHEAETFKKQY